MEGALVLTAPASPAAEVVLTAPASPTAALRAEEKRIAEQFIGGTPWLMIGWGIANTILWLALWPLVLLDMIPLWLGFLLATACVTLCYLPSHDAQHNIIVPAASRFYWLNEMFGHFVIFPLVLPFRAARLTHLQHHRHTNDPAQDPDYFTRAPNAWGAIAQSLKTRQPGHPAVRRYSEILLGIGTGEARLAVKEALVMDLVYFGTLFLLAWNGFAIEAALLWWLPRHIAITYINFYLSWAPHHPAVEAGRYRNTRAFRSLFGNIGSMGMQYHIVHHLYPNIRLNRTPAAYRALKPLLEARDCTLGGLER